jgi:hypothetical protein
MRRRRALRAIGRFGPVALIVVVMSIGLAAAAYFFLEAADFFSRVRGR